MKIIKLRVNDAEMEVLKKASKHYSESISGMIKKIVFEKLEDDHDLKVAQEYLDEKEKGSLKTIPFEDVCKAFDVQ